MSVPDSILFATGNPHKLEEIRAILAPAGLRVHGLEGPLATIDEPVEDGETFEANAILKARYYAHHADHPPAPPPPGAQPRPAGSDRPPSTGGEQPASALLVLADDSGLEVDALGGAPGVRSARYADHPGPREQADRANNAKLVENLRDVPEERRTARFVCVLALCDTRRTLATARGTVEGRILTAPRGENGFGYDPLFYLPELGCTTAQLPPERKNALSHRSRAAHRILDILRATRR